MLYYDQVVKEFEDTVRGWNRSVILETSETSIILDCVEVLQAFPEGYDRLLRLFIDATFSEVSLGEGDVMYEWLP